MPKYVAKFEFFENHLVVAVKLLSLGFFINSAKEMGTNDEFLSYAVSNKVPESTIQNGFFAKLPVHTTLVHPLS